MTTYVGDYCPVCGTKTEQRLVENKLRPVCPNCGHIIYFDPKVAAVAFITQGDQVLLVQRSVDPGIGLWALAGGYVDLYEHPQDTARREALEETGLEVKIERLLDVFYADGSAVTVAYHATVTGGTLTAMDDAMSVQWFSRDENLPELIFISTISLVERWKNGEI